MNPLQIPKILQQMLEFLNISDLLCCRLVNSLWNCEACILLKNHHVVFATLNDISNFTKCFSNTQLCPHKSFIFGSQLLMPQIEFNASNDVIGEFCNYFGPSVLNIHLSLSYDQNLHRMNELLRAIIFKGLPYLESLSLLLKGGSYPNIFEDHEEDCFTLSTLPRIRHLYINCIGYDDILPFVSSILRTCINLETISCKITSPNLTLENSLNNRDYIANHYEINNLQPNRLLSEAILRAILSSSNFIVGIYEHLSNLEVLIKLNDKELTAICEINCKFLKSCFLELDNSVKSATLSNFLCKFKYTLQYVYLEFSVNSLLTLDFPIPMLKLKIIHLTNYTRSMLFIINCPTLHTIIIKNGVQNKNPLFCKLPQNLALSNIKAFKLSCKFTVCNRSLPMDLSNSFPSLTRLHLDNIDNQMLRNVFVNLKSLTHITLMGKEITDGGICGESDKIMKLLFESMVVNETSVPSSDNWDFQPSFPSISGLTNLQFCKIEANLITDACLIFGIARCKLLQELYLFSELELITNFGLNALHKLEDLAYLKINVRNFGWITMKEARRRGNFPELN